MQAEPNTFQLLHRIIQGPAPPFDSSLSQRLGFGIAKGLFISLALTLVLGVGVLAGAGAEIREAGGPLFVIRLYLVVCVFGATLFYAFRPLHRHVPGLLASAVLTVVTAVALAVRMTTTQFDPLPSTGELITMALIGGTVPGLGLAYLQRRNDKRHGLLTADA